MLIFLFFYLSLVENQRLEKSIVIFPTKFSGTFYFFFTYNRNVRIINKN